MVPVAATDSFRSVDMNRKRTWQKHAQDYHSNEDDSHGGRQRKKVQSTKNGTTFKGTNAWEPMLAPQIPVSILLSQVFPFLDRATWNHLAMANKQLWRNTRRRHPHQYLYPPEASLSSSSGSYLPLRPPWPQTSLFTMVADCVVLSSSISSIAFNTDGTLLACGNKLGKVTVWDCYRGAILSFHDCGGASQLRFSPNSRYLACCATTMLFLRSMDDLDDYKLLELSPGIRHFEFVDDYHIATLDSSGRTIRLWRVVDNEAPPEMDGIELVDAGTRATFAGGTIPPPASSHTWRVNEDSSCLGSRPVPVMDRVLGTDMVISTVSSTTTLNRPAQMNLSNNSSRSTVVAYIDALGIHYAWYDLTSFSESIPAKRTVGPTIPLAKKMVVSPNGRHVLIYCHSEGDNAHRGQPQPLQPQEEQQQQPQSPTGWYLWYVHDASTWHCIRRIQHHHHHHHHHHHDDHHDEHEEDRMAVDQESTSYYGCPMVVFSPDGTCIAAASMRPDEGNVIRIWSVRDGSYFGKSLNRHAGNFTSRFEFFTVSEPDRSQV